MAGPVYVIVALVTVLPACDSGGGTTPDPADPVRPFAAPIVGTPMEDVFYGAYLDQGGAGAPLDYACGVKAYGGHRGVDILLRNFRDQDEGVAVVASAAGVVETVVDGLADRNTSWNAGGGFGNHVVLRHSARLRSVYAHLRAGSIEVAVGAEVPRGARLGLVGSSGRSNWPHLHFEVLRDGSSVDPFAGPCGMEESLWQAQLDYQDQFLVTDAGILDSPLSPGLGILLERPPTVSTFPLDSNGFRFWIQLVNQPAGVVHIEAGRPSEDAVHLLDVPVSAAFGMRYLTAYIPIGGVIAEPGEWEVRAWQGGELLHAEPFTVTSAVVGAPSARPAAAPGEVYSVLDQRP